MLQAEAERGVKTLFANGFGAATVRRMEAVRRFRRRGKAAWIASALASAALVAVFATTPVQPKASPTPADTAAEPEAITQHDEQPGRYVRMAGNGAYGEILVQDGATVRYVFVPTAADGGELVLMTDEGGVRSAVLPRSEGEALAEGVYCLEQEFTIVFSPTTP